MDHFNASQHDSHPKLDNFFQSLFMPFISLEFRNVLDNPVTAEELNVAIKTPQNGKSPGRMGSHHSF